MMYAELLNIIHEANYVNKVQLQQICKVDNDQMGMLPEKPKITNKKKHQ